MFLGNDQKVYILDKVEGNAAQINGHPAWGAVWFVFVFYFLLLSLSLSLSQHPSLQGYQYTSGHRHGSLDKCFLCFRYASSKRLLRHFRRERRNWTWGKHRLSTQPWRRKRCLRCHLRRLRWFKGDSHPKPMYRLGRLFIAILSVV